MNQNRILLASLALVALVIAGCNQSTPPAVEEPQAAVESKYLLKTEPAGAKDVGEVRKAAKGDEEVLVVGRIGGDVDPFVEGVAAFTIVDLSLKPCVDGCPTPWDYCCDMNTLPENKVVVKVVDEQGLPIGEDSRKLLGVKPLNTVVVHGTAKRDDAGNLTVLADGVYVKK